MNLYIYFFFLFLSSTFLFIFFFHWLWCCCSSSCSSSSIRPLMYTKTTPCLYTIPSCIFSPLINVDVLSKKTLRLFLFSFLVVPSRRVLGLYGTCRCNDEGPMMCAELFRKWEQFHYRSPFLPFSADGWRRRTDICSLPLHFDKWKLINQIAYIAVFSNSCTASSNTQSSGLFRVYLRENRRTYEGSKSCEPVASCTFFAQSKGTSVEGSIETKLKIARSPGSVSCDDVVCVWRGCVHKLA